MTLSVYKRVVLKLSGEALAGTAGYGINHEVIKNIAEQIKDVKKYNVEIAIVVGGGNIWRGLPPEQEVWIEQQLTIWVCWPR